jgi:nucleoside-diphosphate-sugar epimerase
LNILITGANGFLGSSIVRQALASGIAFRATDLQADSCTSGIDYKCADITNPSTLTPVMTGITGVIHAAGLAHIFSPDANSVEKFRQINEIGTANVASAASAAGVAHLILISSISVYGTYTEGLYDENTPCSPAGPYALSKYNAELRSIEIVRASGMALTILRFATLYGEDDPGNVGRLMRSLDRGRFLWIGDGSNRKSLLYKGDAARACMAVAERPASGINIYNVSAPACTMNEIVAGITAALGKHPFPVRIPASLALLLSRHLSNIGTQYQLHGNLGTRSQFKGKLGHVPKLPSHVPILPRLVGLYQTVKKWLAEDVYDTHRFEEAYGFQTKTSLEDGLNREVDWYRRNTCDD